MLKILEIPLINIYLDLDLLLILLVLIFNSFAPRHGIRQLRTGWSDGPAYITQCPIKGGQSYTYKFTIVNQRGTLLWHAHHSWQRASVYGAFIIYPRMPYPFSAPIQAEIPILFGTYFNCLCVFCLCVYTRTNCLYHITHFKKE